MLKFTALRSALIPLESLRRNYTAHTPACPGISKRGPPVGEIALLQVPNQPV